MNKYKDMNYKNQIKYKIRNTNYINKINILGIDINKNV